MAEVKLISVSLDVSAHSAPVRLSDEIQHQHAKLRRVADFVLGFVENQAEHSLLPREVLERFGVVSLKRLSVFASEGTPSELVGDDPAALFFSHLQKEKICELFDIIGIGQAVVTKNVAVMPELSNQFRC